MRGRSQFTPDDAAQIRSLLIRKAAANKSQQKAIRQQMRDLGFYITDFDTSRIAFTADNFDRLVAEDRVQIIKDPTSTATMCSTPTSSLAPEATKQGCFLTKLLSTVSGLFRRLRNRGM